MSKLPEGVPELFRKALTDYDLKIDGLRDNVDYIGQFIEQELKPALLERDKAIARAAFDTGWSQCYCEIRHRKYFKADDYLQSEGFLKLTKG